MGKAVGIWCDSAQEGRNLNMDDPKTKHRNEKQAVINKNLSVIEGILSLHKVNEAVIDAIKLCMAWTYEDGHRNGVDYVLNFKESRNDEHAKS